MLEYRLPGKWISYLGYNAEVDRIRELKTKVPNPDQEKQQHHIFSVPLGLRYDSRDSILSPKKGIYLNLDLETASEAFGSDLAFLRPVAEARHVAPLPLLKNWHLASRIKAGAIFNTTGLNRTPMIRRFFLGGADSVRGYPYQGLGSLDSAGKPLGGEAMVEGSVEARLPLWGELGGVVFVDMGNAFEIINSDMGKMHFTSGAGLRSIQLWDHCAWISAISSIPLPTPTWTATRSISAWGKPFNGASMEQNIGLGRESDRGGGFYLPAGPMAVSRQQLGPDAPAHLPGRRSGAADRRPTGAGGHLRQHLPQPHPARRKPGENGLPVPASGTGRVGLQPHGPTLGRARQSGAVILAAPPDGVAPGFGL
ncbi:hypothetical protein DFAR_30015 [Desulfarculales bacterium]